MEKKQKKLTVFTIIGIVFISLIGSILYNAGYNGGHEEGYDERDKGCGLFEEIYLEQFIKKTQDSNSYYYISDPDSTNISVYNLDFEYVKDIEINDSYEISFEDSDNYINEFYNVTKYFHGGHMYLIYPNESIYRYDYTNHTYSNKTKITDKIEKSNYSVNYYGGYFYLNEFNSDIVYIYDEDWNYIKNGTLDDLINIIGEEK